MEVPRAPRTIADIPVVERRVASPDGRLSLVTYDGCEYRLGWTSSRIALADLDGTIVETFGGLFKETQRDPAWAPDGSWLAFPSCRGDVFFELAWHVPTSRFAVVPVVNPYLLDVRFLRASLRLQVLPAQVQAANCEETHGAGKAEAPVRRYRATPPVELALVALVVHERDALHDVDGLLGCAPLELGLVEDGFHEYAGPGLSSTTQRVNGRPLEVHHLECFADHGDERAREWLSEVRRRAGAGYDRWATVRSVLGTRSR